MKSKLYFLALAIGMLAINSCKKLEPLNGSNKLVVPVSASDTDVYVAGLVYAQNGKSVAVYWKNGVIHKLTDSSTNAVAESITLRDTDVYVSGTIPNPDGSLTAVYWINGYKVILDNNAGAANGRGIVVTAGVCNVYVAGTVLQGSNGYAVYWKNGVQHRLPGGSKHMEGSGIALNGADVYVSGWGGTASNQEYAFYYKNDSLKVLTDSTINSGQGTSIVVQGNDVYVAGSSVVGGQAIATTWKNGTPTVLAANPSTAPESIATGLAVNGADTYASVTSIENFASYWRNNTETNLITGATTFATVNAIALSGSDVYVTGSSTSASNNAIPLATYWKNGVRKLLPTFTGGSRLQGGQGLSIVVVTHH